MAALPLSAPLWLRNKIFPPKGIQPSGTAASTGTSFKSYSLEFFKQPLVIPLRFPLLHLKKWVNNPRFWSSTETGVVLCPATGWWKVLEHMHIQVSVKFKACNSKIGAILETPRDAAFLTEWRVDLKWGIEEYQAFTWPMGPWLRYGLKLLTPPNGWYSTWI